MTPFLWSALTFAAVTWAVLGVGLGSVVFFLPGLDGISVTDELRDPFALVDFYDRLMNFWTVGMPVGIFGSLVLYRRRSLKPLSPRMSIWYLPLMIAAGLAIPIAVLTFRDVLYPLHGPAGWFPWVALVTFVIGWASRQRLLVAVSLILGLFAVYWYQSGSASLALLPLSFVIGYALVAVVSKPQSSR